MGSTQKKPNSIELYRLATASGWYQLRRLPLVGSECVFLNAISLSLSHGEVPSNCPSTFPFIFHELNRNANRKSGTPVTAKCPTVKCPMGRPQRYTKYLDGPDSGQDAVGHVLGEDIGGGVAGLAFGVRVDGDSFNSDHALNC